MGAPASCQGITSSHRSHPTPLLPWELPAAPARWASCCPTAPSVLPKPTPFGFDQPRVSQGCCGTAMETQVRAKTDGVNTPRQ